MKKLLIPMMAAALVTGLSGTAFAHGHEHAEDAPAATEKAPAKGKGKKHGKGKGKKHAKKNGCASGNGCHAAHGHKDAAKDAPAAEPAAE